MNPDEGQQSINIEDLMKNVSGEIGQLKVDNIMLKTQLQTVLKRNSELEQEFAKQQEKQE